MPWWPPGPLHLLPYANAPNPLSPVLKLWGTTLRKFHNISLAALHKEDDPQPILENVKHTLKQVTTLLWPELRVFYLYSLLFDSAPQASLCIFVNKL